MTNYLMESLSEVTLLATASSTQTSGIMGFFLLFSTQNRPEASFVCWDDLSVGMMSGKMGEQTLSDAAVRHTEVLR